MTAAAAARCPVGEIAVGILTRGGKRVSNLGRSSSRILLRVVVLVVLRWLLVLRGMVLSLLRMVLVAAIAWGASS